MNMIRPVSDLRNNFADISKTVHETAQPVFLTKNGYGDMVVLSMEAFENLQFESEVYFKLQEAEREAELTEQRYSSKDVLKAMKAAYSPKTWRSRANSYAARKSQKWKRNYHCKRGTKQSCKSKTRFECQKWIINQRCKYYRN